MKSLINDCINIENNIKTINLLNDNIKKCKINNNIEFYAGEKNIDIITAQIKTLHIMIKLDSLILNNDEDFNQFYQLISEKIKIGETKLIYRSTVDGFNYESIVNKVNNKSNLIFLYLTENKRIFGVFIKTKLENIDGPKEFEDKDAFVFSLNNNKIYKILEPYKHAIAFNKIYYILIGNSGYFNGFFYYKNVIYDQKLIKDRSTNVYDFSKQSELTGGNGKLIELEIFEVNLI